MNVKTDSAEDTVEILVVEDSPTQAEQLKYLLEQQRYRVMVAENGNQALAVLGEHRPTLVITDIIMPEMDGYGLCKRIKSDEKTQEIPVILLTSLTSSEDVLEGLACGADNFITKPYSEEYLLSSIERILSGRKLRKSERVRIGVEIMFAGKSRFITADQQQMLSLLISTYEAAVHRNTELVQAQDELRALNQRLEEVVEKRTAALSAEIVERKRAEEQLETMLQRQQGVTLLLQSLLAPAPIKDKLRTITDGIVHLFDADFSRIWLIRPGDLCGRDCIHAGVDAGPHICRFRDRCLQLLVSSGRYTHTDGRIHRRVPFGCYKIGRVASDEEHRFLTNDVQNDPRVHNQEWARELGLISFAGYQIQPPGGEKLGVLALFAKHPILSAEDAMLDTLGSAAALVIQQAAAEGALRESEALFRGLFENHAAVKLIIDPDTGNIIDANRAAASFYGWSREHLKHMKIQDINTLSPEEVKEEMEKVRAEKKAHFEFHHRRADGSIRDVDVFSSRIKLKGKDILHSVIHDITARKQAEAERERLMAAVEQVGEMIVITDPEGAIQYVNPAFETVTGYTREEALGQTPRMLKSGEQDEAFYRELWETISGGHSWKGRMVNKRKDGKLYTEAATISPVWDAAGRVVNYVAVKRDITEHLKMEAQFLQAQKLETVGRLTGGIAHDFNNLLTPIIGNAEMALSDMSREDPLYEVMEEIRNAGARAASLTRQLLAFSRKQILHAEILDLNGVVRDMDKMLRRIIGEDIDLETALNPNLGRVEADAGQMEQVLMNLVVNARDAMPKGGKLTLETSNVDLDEGYARNHISVMPGPYVMLAVSDMGVGMSKEVQAQLFEPFFTTKEKGKGTGLGLSTVYGIVKQSKGNIWVYSEPGKGSTFKIYLPRVEESGHARENAKKEEESLQGSETVLVVEDDEMVRNVTLKILQRYGYAVLCARDGQEALRMCREHKEQVQLMLTDVVMPGMGGRDLEEKLQKIQPGMKVLFMSGYTDNAIVHHGMLDKGIAFLQKPFTPEGLARKVRAVLGDR
jgi:PAS domain S-box-containing protein